MNDNYIRDIVANDFDAIFRCVGFADRMTCLRQNTREFLTLSWFARDDNTGLIGASHLI